MNWTYFDPTFESEVILNDLDSAWAGHRYFAYDLIANLKPKTVVELGTHRGTSFFAFCQAVKDLNLECALFAIDSWKGDPHASFYGEEVYELVKDTTNKFYSCLQPHLLRMNFDEAIGRFEDNSIDLLHIDGYHTYEAVKHDFETWISKTSENGFILFHDTYERKDDFGVFRFWDELKKKFKTIEFHHSHGLGILIRNSRAKNNFAVLQDVWTRYYSLYYNAKKLSGNLTYKEQEVESLIKALESSKQDISKHVQESKQKEIEIDQLKITIQQQGHLFSEAEFLIRENDNTIKEKNNIILEKEKLLVEARNSIQEKDTLVQEKERLLVEARNSNQEKDNLIQEKESLLVEARNSNQEKDTLVQEKERLLVEARNSIQEKDTINSTTNQKLQDALQIIKENERITQNKEQNIRSLYNSYSWKITKPFRWLHPRLIAFFYFFFPYGSKRWAIIKRIVQAIHRIIFNSHQVPVQPNTQIVKKNITETPNVEIEEETDKTIFYSSTSILFIGHDAFLAGAEVLLLSLIKWFGEHTAIRIKIILLRGGILLDKFSELAPTMVWDELIQRFPDAENRRKKILEFTGKVNLIYGNTVVAPSIYDELKFLGVPYITHVHELEKSIKIYVEKSTVEKMRLFTTAFIACSKPVGANLIDNHFVEKEKITTIHEFVEDKKVLLGDSKYHLREKLGLIKEGLVVFGCGTIYWRKGVDLFIDTAIRLKQKGLKNFHFYWIGENLWDEDESSLKFYSWNDLQKKIRDAEVQDHMSFLGVKENTLDYFLSGDLFYLPSREDPYPLVCLEAAQCGLPIICFEDAGGMPDFVQQDAGFVVPFEDVNTVAEKIRYLDRNRRSLDELGLTARKKYLELHTIDIAAPGILDLCRKIGNLLPAVSVIVPNYNCEKYLGKRLDSIVNQTFQDFEIILLDDSSTDNSLLVIDKYLHLPSIRLLQNQKNSGNPFIQWHKGYSLAKGEILWFAEADDFCDDQFLHKLMPCFNDDSVALAYCDSFIVDESDKVTGDYSAYTGTLDPNHWKASYQVTGQREINYGLGVKNSIPNASAVLIRRSCITEKFFNETFQFKFSGDWFFYTQVIKGKDIAFCSEKLNYHRKHNQTVTTKFNLDQSAIQLLFKEQEIIHEIILKSFPIDSRFLNKWEIHISDQLLTYDPKILKNDFNKYYPYNSAKEKIQKAIIKSKQSKRLVFLTMNDYSTTGGSEQLWIKSAKECRKRGHNVMVVIKNWDPAPYFIQEFYDIGITILFKGHDDFNQVLLFQPDLLVVSTGDMDEGIEWYDPCQKHNIPYVIINQLTKEPEYWPIKNEINEQVKNGYLGAATVFFTCNNNHEVMEKRINCKIPNASRHYNPFHIDRNSFVPFPPMDDGLKIAIPANLSRVHKGQHLAIELFSQEKWRERPIQLNIYGEGYDEEVLKTMARDYKLKKVFFHKHTHDLLIIWRDNHAIFMPSFMEGLPIVLVGAMICARVPILTDIGAHREMVDDNINGFIAKKPTIEALDEALERAYQKSAMWEEMGQRARERILAYLPPIDPVDDFISKIIPLAIKKK